MNESKIDVNTISKKDTLWNCLYLFIFALAVRGFYYIGFMDNPFFDYVASVFDQINFDKAAIGFANGNIMAEGGAEGYAPLYKYFLGIIYWIFGRDFYVIWAIQFTIGAVSSVFMYLITIRYFNKWVAIICSIFFATYGPNIFYEGNLLRASLTEFLAIVSFYCLLKCKEEVSFKYTALSAGLLSLLIQCRPNTMTLIPFVTYYLIMIILNGRPNKVKTKHIVVFVAVLVSVGIPLMVRTIMVHKQFVFYDTSGDHAILAGNLKAYSGGGWDDGLYIEKMVNIIANNGGDDFNVYKYVLKEFVTYPVEYFKLYCRKIYWFLNNYEYPSNVNYYLYQNFSFVLKNPIGSFSLLVALGFVGIGLTYKNYKRYLLIYFFVIGLMLSVILVYPVSRFRIPFVPFFMIFSSYTLYYVAFNIYKKKVIIPLIIVAVVVLLVYSLKIPNKGIYKVRPLDYENLGSGYYNNKRVYDFSKSEALFKIAWNMNVSANEEAINNYNQKIAKGEPAELILNRNVTKTLIAKIYSSLAVELFKSEDYNGAIKYANRVVELDYTNIEAFNILKLSHIVKKDYLQVVKVLKHQVIIKPQDARYYYDLAVLYNKFNLGYSKYIYYIQKALLIDHDVVKKTDSNYKKIMESVKNNISDFQKDLNVNKFKIAQLLETANKAITAEQFESAIANCKMILNMDYSNFNAHIFLAHSYEKLGLYDELVSEYIDILTFNLDSFKTHYNLYNIYRYFKNDHVRALYHLEKCVELDPNQNSNLQLEDTLRKFTFLVNNAMPFKW